MYQLSVMSLRLGEKKQQPGRNPERLLLWKCNYVPFITLNTCSINSDALHRNQITAKTYDICPFPFSSLLLSILHKVSLCPTNVSGGLGRRICECAGIQRGAKFRPLTWLRTQGSQPEGPLEYQWTPQSPSYWHRAPFKNLALSVHTGANCSDHASQHVSYWKWMMIMWERPCDPNDAPCVFKTFLYPKHHRCNVLSSRTSFQKAFEQTLNLQSHPLLQQYCTQLVLLWDYPLTKWRFLMETIAEDFCNSSYKKKTLPKGRSEYLLYNGQVVFGCRLGSNLISSQIICM